MDMNHGIAVEAAVTVDGNCDVSCEVVDDQIRLIFGRTDTGLQLYFDWPGLDRLLAVTRAAMTRVQMTPQDTKIDFMVSADATAREAHRPNYPHDYSAELLLSDLDNQPGRHHLL
jgi:hypothetical protein